MRLFRGRSFSALDGANAAKVAILNETAARFYFGERDPVGQNVRLVTDKNSPAYQVIGVVKDGKHANLRDATWRFLYVPIAQSPDGIGRLALSIRIPANSQATVSSVMTELRALRPPVLITNVATMDELVGRSMVRERLLATLSTGFGLLALVLAGIGLYGLLAYAVARRTNEIGIRMALGATSKTMIASIVQECMLLAACGIAVAIPAVGALGSLSNALLFGVDSLDAISLSGSIGVLLIVAFVAGIVPARRASRVDPMTALRVE